MRHRVRLGVAVYDRVAVAGLEDVESVVVDCDAVLQRRGDGVVVLDRHLAPLDFQEYHNLAKAGVHFLFLCLYFFCC